MFGYHENDFVKVEERKQREKEIYEEVGYVHEVGLCLFTR